MPELLLAPRTSRQAIALGAERLSAAGCETPRLDAELLLASALGHGSRTRLVLDAEACLDSAQAADYERLLGRRERREPVAYIVGYKWFRGIALSVDPRVLIPRPETELLVEVALDLAPGARVSDVGTGCGAVALALKIERPDLAVTGIDVSEDALDVARENRDRLRVDIELVRADLLDRDGYEAVVANLPYVPQGDRLAPEIELFEPPGAVYAGADGLDVVRRLCARLGSCASVRFVALEIGCGQANTTGELLRRAAFNVVETRSDLAGHERVVVASR